VKTRPGICQKKRRFASRGEADAVALAAGITLRTYKCAVCGEFHLTSRTKGLRAPRAGDGDAQ
jgi:spore maturation protein CgeB